MKRIEYCKSLSEKWQLLRNLRGKCPECGGPLKRTEKNRYVCLEPNCPVHYVTFKPRTAILKEVKRANVL